MATWTAKPRAEATWTAKEQSVVPVSIAFLLIGGGYYLEVGGGYRLVIQPANDGTNWTAKTRL